MVSTRAGSLGINLVGANRVIVFDASWNPCHDTQAVCRVYRYGQKKPCFVYRLVMDNCLEKKIYDRQINKQGMADRVVDECNPDAHLSIKEVTSLCWDDEKESEIKDFSEFKDKYIDIVMQKVLVDHSTCLTKEPFQHESLLVDRKEKKLSSAEKRLAQRGYEIEKQQASRPSYSYTSMGTTYRAIRTQDGAIVHRPVASVRPMQAEINNLDKNNTVQRTARPTRWIPAEVWQRQGMTAQEMTLPLDVVIPTSSADKSNIVLKAGQKVMVLKSPKGIYMQLETGKIIAIRTALKMGQNQTANNSTVTAKDASKSPALNIVRRPTATAPSTSNSNAAINNIPNNLKNNTSITVTPTSKATVANKQIVNRVINNKNVIKSNLVPKSNNVQTGATRPANMNAKPNATTTPNNKSPVRNIVKSGGSESTKTNSELVKEETPKTSTTTVAKKEGEYDPDAKDPLAFDAIENDDSMKSSEGSERSSDNKSETKSDITLNNPPPSIPPQANLSQDNSPASTGPPSNPPQNLYQPYQKSPVQTPTLPLMNPMMLPKTIEDNTSPTVSEIPIPLNDLPYKSPEIPGPIINHPTYNKPDVPVPLVPLPSVQTNSPSNQMELIPLRDKVVYKPNLVERNKAKPPVINNVMKQPPTPKSNRPKSTNRGFTPPMSLNNDLPQSKMLSEQPKPIDKLMNENPFDFNSYPHQQQPGSLTTPTYHTQQQQQQQPPLSQSHSHHQQHGMMYNQNHQMPLTSASMQQPTYPIHDNTLPKYESSLNYLERTTKSINEKQNEFQSSLSNITRPFTPTRSNEYNNSPLIEQPPTPTSRSSSKKSSVQQEQMAKNNAPSPFLPYNDLSSSSYPSPVTPTGSRRSSTSNLSATYPGSHQYSSQTSTTPSLQQQQQSPSMPNYQNTNSNNYGYDSQNSSSAHSTATNNNTTTTNNNSNNNNSTNLNSADPYSHLHQNYSSYSSKTYFVIIFY